MKINGIRATANAAACFWRCQSFFLYSVGVGTMRVHPERVRLLVLFACALIAAAVQTPLQGQASPELTTVRQIRALTPDQAAKARPVRLRGVVTVLSGWKY